jgi:DNA-binding beta-propeller fold protein YncE
MIRARSTSREAAMRRREFLVATTAALACPGLRPAEAAPARHLLYVATPGIRNYVEYGGVGVLVFDIAEGYRFVKRIPTWEMPEGQAPENVKGIAASAATGRLYVSTIKRIACWDLVTERKLWENALAGGCDRMAIAPDGKLLYVPSLEGLHWNVVDGATGDLITKVLTGDGAHNTIYSRDGRHAYLASLRSTSLSVADTRTHTVVKQVGPFTKPIRPFTVNGAQTRCYVNINDLLGFEVGDLTTGKMLHRVEVQGYQAGPVKRHACPSHGIGLTPNEEQLWVCDGHNSALHVFDNTVMPPKQIASIPVRDQPGWISFSLDGARAYSSTGEIFDTRTRKLVVALEDETKRQVGSEKLVEIVFDGDKPVRANDQFGFGTKV